jgi:hypothetical protein
MHFALFAIFDLFRSMHFALFHHWIEDPMAGWQTGTARPLLPSKQERLCPVDSGDVPLWRAAERAASASTRGSTARAGHAQSSRCAWDARYRRPSLMGDSDGRARRAVSMITVASNFLTRALRTFGDAPACVGGAMALECKHVHCTWTSACCVVPCSTTRPAATTAFRRSTTKVASLRSVRL